MLRDRIKDKKNIINKATYVNTEVTVLTIRARIIKHIVSIKHIEIFLPRVFHLLGL
jgi:hypothetical protein